MNTLMKWIAAVILAFFLGLLLISYLYGVSLRNAGIIMARNGLKQAKKDYEEHGYVTNYGSSGYQVWLSSNIVTIGATQYQCFITVRDARFGDEGVLAMTTNDVLIWLDAKRQPRWYRPVGEVVDEIRRMPGRALIFWDDNIGANRAYAKELFAAIAPLKRWWTSQCTADVAFDDTFLSLAAGSGCKALFLGLETISQASLNTANKRHNRAAEYREVIQRFHAHGIAVQAGVVFGFDHDDRSIFRTTVEFFREAGLDSATVSVLIPFPNTPLFKRLDAEGRILTRDWSKYNGKKDVVFQPALMSPRELLMGMEWAARQFYSLGSIVERMARSRTGLWWNIARNLGYHLALRNFGDVGFNPESPENPFPIAETANSRIAAAAQGS
jgi:hypothetical protein